MTTRIDIRLNAKTYRVRFYNDDTASVQRKTKTGWTLLPECGRVWQQAVNAAAEMLDGPSHSDIIGG